MLSVKSCLEELLKKGSVVGKKYTVQAIYSLNMDEDSEDFVETLPCRYSVCENIYIDFDGKKKLIPAPIENFELDDIENAVKRFIELENGQGPD